MQTIGATARKIFKRQKTSFTRKSESTVNTVVRRRTAGESLSKLVTVAAILLITATMTEMVATGTMTEIAAIGTMTEIVITTTDPTGMNTTAATGTMTEIVITTAAKKLAIQSDCAGEL